MTLRSRILLYLVTALAVFTHHALASVLAIDYGADWIKASLMKPGVPFDVLLNRDSKRKIQSSVGWKGDDRLFGGDAANAAGRFPQDSFSSLKFLQAAPYDAQVVEFFASISTGEAVQTSRGTVALRRKDGTTWAVEELVAMQLAYVKDLAEGLAGERVSDVVVTVPPFYSQFERDAVADAVEIAGLRTLALVNDGTAVAVNYAMTRTFAAPEYHVMYDAGASSIRATVVQLETVEGNKKKKTGEYTQITIVGVGYDRTVGGTELDRRVRDLLLADFQQKHKKDLREDKRGMARLWKEASRVKSILSANADSRVTVESIAWDIDYKSKMSREQFENACADLKPKFIEPITEAIANAGLTLDQITSVVLTGGASRTPMIKDAVTKAVGADKIAVNVNADEAAVLGAAFYGAGLSRQFKTKDIRVQDISVHDVVASYPGEKRGKTITANIFPQGSKTGTRKTMTFKRKDDFALTLSYKLSPLPGFPVQLLEAHITGIAEAVKNLTSLGASDPVVKATLALSESGFASVKEAFVVGEIKDDSFTGKLKGLFGGGSSSESSTAASGSTDGASSTTSSASSATADAEKEKPTKASVKEEKIPLTIDVKFVSVPPMTVEEKRTARDRLRAIDAQEAAKRANEDARNTLESYLYRVRDLLDNDNTDTPFRKCSKATERNAISARLSETMAWMHDNGDGADTKTLLSKRNDLESLEQPIIHRYKEIEEFPQALNSSQMWNWSTRLFITEAQANRTVEEKTDGPYKYTKEELAALEKHLIEHETWLNIHVEKQKAVPMNEDPVIETSEMKRRADELSQELQRLVRRRAPVKPKKSKSTTATGTTTSSEAEDASSKPSTSTSTPSDTPDKHDEL